MYSLTFYSRETTTCLLYKNINKSKSFRNSCVFFKSQNVYPKSELRLKKKKKNE